MGVASSHTHQAPRKETQRPRSSAPFVARLTRSRGGRWGRAVHARFSCRHAYTDEIRAGHADPGKGAPVAGTYRRLSSRLPPPAFVTLARTFSCLPHTRRWPPTHPPRPFPTLLAMPPVPARPRPSWTLPPPPAAAGGPPAGHPPPPAPPPVDWLGCLPDELLDCVVAALPTAADVVALAGTCRRLAAVAAPRVAALRAEAAAARAAAAAAAPQPQPSHPLFPL